ncbi:carotenoid 1,2-hydratase [Vibrio sp. CAIM 722]|uniref:Carotenoid 1,2-hydratase n=1 Tax=Vibrio eleionomae TaxID=2653505 RepID=A0A7X4LN27_9VIBR|nr:lipocalin-like domain-containing protein [Vibrio eleionomae]MZI94796.1 carotenoid 1,2-hydratase [Vibrio eleionomae]
MKFFRRNSCVPVVIGIIVLFFVALAYLLWSTGAGLLTGSLHSKKAESFFLNQQHYQQVMPDHPVVLPDDFAFHPSFQNEWWSFVANVEDEQGNRYGVHWNLMRLAHDDRKSVSWDHPQLYLAQVAISHKHQVWFDQKLARGGIGQAGFQREPFKLWIDNWSLNGKEANPFPGELNTNTDQVSLQLGLALKQPIQLPGEQGYQHIEPSLSAALYGFDVPQVAVAGKIRIKGQRKALRVHGVAWIGKRWGNNFVLESNRHWDWLVFHIQNGMTLTVTRFRQQVQAPRFFGTITSPQGESIALTQDDMSMIPTLNTTTNGHLVPTQWHIKVPRYHINFTATAVNANMWFPYVVPYWEGPVNVSGSHNARGFMILSGY